MKLLLALALWGAVASPVTAVKIVNGYPCQPHSVPWQVLFTVNGRSLCGGSLINQWWILTAGHCYAPPTALVAHLGEHDTKQLEGTEQRIGVAHVIRHQKYYDKINPVLNDIMLVKLARPATINRFVSPIRLPSRCPAPGTRCLASGWGNLAFLGPSPPNLQCLDKPILPDAHCQRVYRPFTRDMLCAGFPEGGKGTCQGDSGGPLVCNGQLQGIVSSGYKCALAGYPSIFTKVCNYIPWIRHVMSSY